MLQGKKNRLFIMIATMIISLLVTPLIFAQDTDAETSTDEMLKETLAIYNDNAFDLIPAVYSADIILHHSSFPEPLVGIEAFTGFVKANAVGFSDFKLSIDHIWQDGDMRFSFWKATGTNDGEYNGNPPTGKKISIWGLSSAKVVDGKSVEEWIAFNHMTMMNQLMPPKEDVVAPTKINDIQ